MSLNLDIRKLNRLLEKEEFRVNISNEELLYYLDKTFKRTIKIFDQIYDNKFKSGFELSEQGEDINPILWQCGHIIYFYKKHCQHFFNLKTNEYINNIIDFYDSFKTKSKFRSNEEKLLSIYILKEEFKELYDIFKNSLFKEKENTKKKYVLLLSVLHNEMHIEALIFSGLHLDYHFKDFMSVGLTNISLRGNSINIIKKPKFIKIEKGNFIQGSKSLAKYLSFDNERPVFRKFLEEFEISETPITEYQFLQFILANGYEKKEYWEEESWEWIQKNNINCPLYWNLSPEHLKLRGSNFPVCNISWYEAKAYCRWSGNRLPTESEWEYVATFGGRYNYPWGNTMIPKYCNLNYTVNRPLEVDDTRLKAEKSLFNVKQLIGNVWEWCEEPIYPYDGFNIDPVYREMSYPFFGFKKICRGGCFAVPDNLIHSRYRNAQMPDCRIQFIGFRVCKIKKKLIKKDETDFREVREIRRKRIGLCTDL